MKKQISKKKTKKSKQKKLRIEGPQLSTADLLARDEFFKVARVPKKEQHKFLVIEV